MLGTLLTMNGEQIALVTTINVATRAVVVKTRIPALLLRSTRHEVEVHSRSNRDRLLRELVAR